MVLSSGQEIRPARLGSGARPRGAVPVVHRPQRPVSGQVRSSAAWADHPRRPAACHLGLGSLGLCSGSSRGFLHKASSVVRPHFPSQTPWLPVTSNRALLGSLTFLQPSHGSPVLSKRVLNHGHKSPGCCGHKLSTPDPPGPLAASVLQLTEPLAAPGKWEGTPRLQTLPGRGAPLGAVFYLHTGL